MTAEVISLCEYRKSKDAEKRLKNENALGILRPGDFHDSLLKSYDPYFNLDEDD